MLSNAITKRILQRFPDKLAFCFAYGSGVKKQSGYTEATLKNSIIDLMICVDDPYNWHKENLKCNPSDYSFMRYFGPSFITDYQEGYGAQIYCNTLVPIENGCFIKYGVITSDDLCDDLNHWTHLYTAGRLHKPVETLVEPNSKEIQVALANNLQSAITVALLLLPEKFTYYDLFYEISQMSYNGDFRMYFGENKDKVKNIVKPQLNSFFQLYIPYLKEFKFCVHLPNEDALSKDLIVQDKSTVITRQHCSDLPMRVIKALEENNMNEEQLLKMNSKTLASHIRKELISIVYTSSGSQSIKNIPTAGFGKAIRYSWKKALKTFEK